MYGSQEKDAAAKINHVQIVAEAKQEQQQWLPLWRDLNEAFYPFIYRSLFGDKTNSKSPKRNTKLLDGASANALLVLSAGFMNGVTSPARKWVNVKRPTGDAYKDPSAEQSEYHADVRAKILEVLTSSNYYESRAMQVYDGCGIGTGALLCYEDDVDVAKFVLCPPGTYYLITDNSNKIVGFARELTMKLSEALAEFGEDGLSKDQVAKAKMNDNNSRKMVNIMHLIEAGKNDGLLPSRAPYREVYWQTGKSEGAPCYLAKRPLYEWPVAVMRWSCPDNVTYGIPPSMTVLGKAIQLQNNEYKTDQGFDKMVSPPILADRTLQNRPKAFSAGGVTFVSNMTANSGARPVMNLQMPIQELAMRRQQIVESIEEGMFNPLFNMVSQLDTVRSATEIDARREEKLVMLGPVLQRGYNEDLGVIVLRVYGICLRKGVIEAPPPGDDAIIEFSNVLSDVQKASDVSTIERFFGFTGSLLAGFPELQAEVNASDLLRQYAEGLGIKPSSLKKQVEAEAANEQGAQMQQLAQVSEVAKNFGAAAGSSGNVDVGGGMNAVQALLGG